MDLTLRAQLSSTEETKLGFLYDRGLIIDATYLKDSLPKQKLSIMLDRNQIFELYGILDSVLSGNHVWETMVDQEAQTSITIRLSKAVAEKVFEIKFEKHAKDGKFITFMDSAKSFSTLRVYLKILLQKLV